jgi:hypothetical protein
MRLKIFLCRVNFDVWNCFIHMLLLARWNSRQSCGICTSRKPTLICACNRKYRPLICFRAHDADAELPGACRHSNPGCLSDRIAFFFLRLSSNNSGISLHRW